MATVKEMMAAKKAKKAQTILKQQTRNMEREAKKFKSKADDDYIPFYEWATSSYAQYIGPLKQRIIDNKITYFDLAENFTQLHRLTYFPCEYDFANVRKMIEKVMHKYLYAYDMESVKEVYTKQVNLHWYHREMFVTFLTILAERLSGFRSRKEFATMNADMILNHELATKIRNITANRFIDWSIVAEAKIHVDSRRTAKEVYQDMKQTIAIFKKEVK